MQGLDKKKKCLNDISTSRFQTN